MTVSYYLSRDYWSEVLSNLKLSWKFYRSLEDKNDLSNLESMISDIPHFLEHLKYIKGLYVEFKSAPDWRIRTRHKEELVKEVEDLLKFTYEEHEDIKSYLIEKKKFLREELSHEEEHEELVAYGGGSTTPILNGVNGKNFEDVINFEI